MLEALKVIAALAAGTVVGSAMVWVVATLGLMIGGVL